MGEGEGKTCCGSLHCDIHSLRTTAALCGVCRAVEDMLLALDVGCAGGMAWHREALHRTVAGAWHKWQFAREPDGASFETATPPRPAPVCPLLLDGARVGKGSMAAS
jgi:hypothetical protein